MAPKDLEDKEDQTIEDKAEDIGRKVEAEKKDEEVIPDYDVKELDVEKESADADEDERIAKGKDGSEHERGDRKQLSNREKRQMRKKRISEKFDAKDAIIRQQQEQLNSLAGRLNDVDGRLSTYDHSQLQKAYDESIAAFRSAEAKHSEAFSTGDGAKATLAMREMYVAQKRIDDLEAINARQQNTQRQPVRAPQADVAVVSKATSWADRNPWFKPGATDDDSAIADTIASKLVKEGYDPKSDDYWDELDERLETKGVGQRDEEQEEERRPNKQQRRSPPIGGGGGRGDIGNGKVQVSLPTAYINALKENGKWDDPVTRNRMIKRYIDGVRNRETA